MTSRVEALDDVYDLGSFSCGNLELDRWLRDHARRATAQGTRTYVVLDDEDDDAVVGYFAIVPHVLDRGDAPPKLGRGAPRQIPAILLAKLVLSEHLHGQGLDAELLVRALDVIIDAARVAGGKLVVVDAIDGDAEAFYRRHDFQQLPSRNDRLVMKLSTAASALKKDWHERELGPRGVATQGPNDDDQRTLFPQVRGNYRRSRNCADRLAKVRLLGLIPPSALKEHVERAGQQSFGAADARLQRGGSREVERLGTL